MDRLECQHIENNNKRECCKNKKQDHVHMNNQMTNKIRRTTSVDKNQVRHDYLLINNINNQLPLVHRARRKKSSSSFLDTTKVRIRTPLQQSKGILSTTTKCQNYLLLQLSVILIAAIVSIKAQQSAATNSNGNWPDLTSSTSDEPIVAIVGQDAFISCVVKNLQNYTIIWRYTNDANAPGAIENNNSASAGNSWSDANNSGDNNGKQVTNVDGEMGIILSAGRQRVIADDRFSVIQSHDTWLLKIQNVRLSDTGTYICHTNSEPRRRAFRILSVIKSMNNINANVQDVDSVGK